MIPIILGLSSLDAVPRLLRRRSGRPVGALVLDHLVELVPAEFLLRGFLMFALWRRIGPLALVVQLVPFVLTHIGKPDIELWSTFIGGSVFAWLNWRTGSILWSALGHVYVLTLMLAGRRRRDRRRMTAAPPRRRLRRVLIAAQRRPRAALLDRGRCLVDRSARFASATRRPASRHRSIRPAGHGRAERDTPACSGGFYARPWPNHRASRSSAHCARARSGAARRRWAVHRRGRAPRCSSPTARRVCSAPRRTS